MAMPKEKKRRVFDGRTKGVVVGGGGEGEGESWTPKTDSTDKGDLWRMVEKVIGAKRGIRCWYFGGERYDAQCDQMKSANLKEEEDGKTAKRRRRRTPIASWRKLIGSERIGGVLDTDFNEYAGQVIHGFVDISRNSAK